MRFSCSRNLLLSQEKNRHDQAMAESMAQAVKMGDMMIKKTFPKLLNEWKEYAVFKRGSPFHGGNSCILSLLLPRSQWR
jgi:hypothetical protein